MQMRELRADEAPFIREMVYTAIVGWRPDVELPPREAILEHHQVEPFHEDWGRAGDTAVVAEDDGELLGLVWYRFFTSDRHGEGYVDDETPELAIAVVDGQRGRGIGRMLMDAIHAHVREQGVARISLSVDADNPAKRLYERLGYVALSPGDERMVLELA